MISSPNNCSFAPSAFAALVMITSLTLGARAAQAQDSGEPAVLEEIIVTAQKREQQMQKVPIAMSVVSAADIESRSISDFTELLQLMPNTTIGQNISAIPNISIRGVSSNVDNIGIESGVGVSVDDVFLGRPSAFSTNLIDVERVEVLRGPQGTLFGKNTIGGLINIVTKKPSNEFGAEFDATLGEDDLQQFRGFVTGPLSKDKVAGKISVTTKKSDGWVTNANPAAQDLQSVDFWGVRGQLLGTSSENFGWLFSAEYSEDDSVENYNDVLSGGLAPVDGDPFDRMIGTSENDLFTREIYGYSLKLDWSSDNFDFVSITGARGVDWSGRNDQDYTVLNFFEAARSEDQDQFSQEFQIHGGSDNFTWIGGLYYFDQKQDGVDSLFLGEDTPPFFGAPFIPGYVERSETVSAIDTTSIAAFYSGTYSINDRWTFDGGVRYTSEDKDFNFRQDLFFFEVAPGVPVGIIAAINPAVAPMVDSRSDSDWSGNLSLSYQFRENVNGYAKITRGFKAGGFDTTTVPVGTPGDLSFEPETMISYELGLKSDLADRRVRLNIAAFHSDYEDKQEQFFNGIVAITSNAAAATISGVELDLTARPVEWFTFGASVGFQDASYDSYVDTLSAIDFTGNDLPNIPDQTASVFVQIDKTTRNNWGWMFRLDAAYNEETFVRPSNDPFFVAEDNTLVNGRIGFSSPEGRYSVAVWAKNLLDEDFERRRSEISGLGTQYVVLNRPRTWGVELRGRFGQ